MRCLLRAALALLAAASALACSSSGDSPRAAEGGASSVSTTSTTSTTSKASATSTGAGGAAACGCHGEPGCAVWTDVYVSWYGYNDNSCGTEQQHGCNDIANPGLGPMHHMGATAGKGTFDDPSTCAASDTSDMGHTFESAGGATLKPGTLVYNPEVEQYFIFEDSCLECGDENACKRSQDDTDDPRPPASCEPGANLHIDFWMGPSDAMQPHSLVTCEDDATIGAPYHGKGVVVVNPPPDLPVKVGALYPNDGSPSGGCFTKAQAPVATCP